MSYSWTSCETEEDKKNEPTTAPFALIIFDKLYIEVEVKERKKIIASEIFL